MLVAIPIIQNATFHTFTPYLIENLADKVGDSAAVMSLFLGRSNPEMYQRTFNEDFYASVNGLAEGKISEAEFRSQTASMTEPFETTLQDYNIDFSCKSYPAIYIEGETAFCDPGIKEAADILIASEWFADYRENNLGRYLYSPIIALPGQTQDEGYFAYVYSAYADMDSQNAYYALLFTRFSDIMELWRDVIGADNDDYAFIGLDYNVLYQNSQSTDLDFDWIPENLTSNRQHHVVTYNDGGFTLFSVLISYEREGLRFVMSASKDTYLGIFKDINITIQIILLTFILIFIVIVLIIFRGVFSRLTALSDKMAVVQDGNYDVKLDDLKNDEIGRLAATFNVMTDKIRENVNQLVEKEQQEKLLQYNLMVSAIDPHFINNTLNTSTRLAELGRTDDVVNVNDALINLLKNNLKMKSSQVFDTVSNELEALREYIKIQNYLCDNTISLDYDISEDEMALEIPKFLLQPLVENAILHGILLNIDEEGNNIAGKIKISVGKDNGRITIKVTDNGIGMPQETIDRYFSTDKSAVFNEKTGGEHIGIINVRTRLAHLYNDDYRFTAESEPGKGAVITIEIPDDGHHAV
jgi:signal transduction histidine kinase